MRRFSLLLLASGAVLAGCAHAGPRVATSSATAVAPAGNNPFFLPSRLPFQAPPFDRIRDADYQPALEEGMRQERVEIDAIAAQTASPTFENTILPMERSGRLLGRVSSAFSAVAQANTNDFIQRVQAEESPKLAAHSDAIHLDDKLFARIRSLYDRREALGLTPEQKAVVERYYRDFVRSGALLPEASKARLRQLNQEESRLTTDFRHRLLAGTRAGALVLDDRASLAGLSDAEVTAAAEAAKSRGLVGKWVLPLQNTTQQPAQASLADRAVRQRLFAASVGRTDRGNANDTRDVVKRLAQLRAERARLMGYPSFAAFALEDRMAKTPEAAVKLLMDIAGPATAKARAEAGMMQALIDKQGGGFKLAPWDWQYYAEQVRKAEYDLDQTQVKPYFEMERVLRDGVFFAANKLYGLTFKERKDIPVYHPDVRVFEVFDADGKALALFYCDYLKRDNKSGGAWSTSFVGQSGLLGTKPVVSNVANFQKPPAGQPALLTFDEVSTMFHEFGHALHAMFSNVQYPSLAGTRVPRDFVEFPSQFNENWALEPAVFANYARHYQTGAPMPQALVDRIRKAGTFNQGFETTEAASAALLDMAWHSLPADAPQQDPDVFEAEALRRFHVDMPEVPPRYHTTYFSHIWGSGYSAGYYAYMWAEVIDHDAFAWFEEHGGMTRANGQRLRDMILSRGGSGDVAALYRAFRGRDPSIEPLLRARGLGSETAAK